MAFEIKFTKRVFLSEKREKISDKKNQTLEKYKISLKKIIKLPKNIIKLLTKNAKTLEIKNQTFEKKIYPKEITRLLMCVKLKGSLFPIILKLCRQFVPICTQI